ncbi:hypothetical protein [Azospirillum endophyticum]
MTISSTRIRRVRIFSILQPSLGTAAMAALPPSRPPADYGAGGHIRKREIHTRVFFC